MLYTVRDAVDVIAGVLGADQVAVAELVELNQVKNLLNIVYAGDTSPMHKTVLEALGAMCLRALTGEQKFVSTRRDHCLAALVVSIAHRHGVELNLRPIKLTLGAFGRMRSFRALSGADISDWLRTRMVEGSSDQPMTVPACRPELRGDVVALGRPVSEADQPARKRDDFLVRKIHAELVPRGAQVLVPVPRTDGSEPWASETVLRGDAAVRMGRGSFYLGLGDDPSSGVGAEMMVAQQLRLPVVVLKRHGKLSNRFDPDLVEVIPYGRRPQAAGELVAAWMMEHRWLLANSARRRADRELVSVRQRTALLCAWRNCSAEQRALVTETVRLNSAQVAACLQSAVGFELVGVGCVDDLHAALDVPLPGPVEASPRFEEPELEALARVCEQRHLGILEAYLATDALLIELSSDGSRRGQLDSEELWHRYFDEAGLDGRN